LYNTNPEISNAKLNRTPTRRILLGGFFMMGGRGKYNLLELKLLHSTNSKVQLN